ncbi:glycoside hydrolase family 31 protein [Gyrodon lividus]|nr:glycoside hydrolase family 31 protein [Gyrodon lividus]
MKFNDGFWLPKHGVKAYYGLQAIRVKTEPDGVALQVATRAIRHRGDTLGGPLLSVKVHSPTQCVIGVRIDHFKHVEQSPAIPLFPDVPPIPDISVSRSETSTILSTGGLTAEITENPYTITFKNSRRILTAAGFKHQAVFDIPYRWTVGTASSSSCLALDPSSNPHPTHPPEHIRYVHSELNMSPGELIYGLGEQFGAFVKNGQTVSIWNRDGGTSSEQAYKCVPFYITNRNYGVFINHAGEVEVEVGTEKVSRVGVSVAAESLEYFIIYGETPLDILERYTRMTGRPALIPPWTFGLWLSTSFLTSYSAETVAGFLQGMQEHSCPVRVFHFDCFWMKQYEWCSVSFDPDNFPDPKAYLSEIKRKFNVKICVWINPYISQLSPIFEEGMEGGYFIKRTDGTPWQWDLWQPGLAILDVTNPEGCKWYVDKLSALLDLGVDTFKTDFGERIPHANIKYHNGSDPMRMHNAYAVMYNEIVFKLLEKRFGKGEAVVFARASAAGGQRFPVHWGGDCESTFEAMAEALRGALSLTVSGFGFASHDIGGFEGHPPPEIYQRWVAFGVFSSHSRLHGSSSYRVPWQYGDDVARSMSKLLDAKHRLMPYIYTHAVNAHINGHPVPRAMFLEFLEDRTTHYLDRQYMLGPSLLVAPVFVPQEEETEYYIPAGCWTSFFNPQRTIQGPTWVHERVPLDEIPVWIRPNRVLCLGAPGKGRPDYALNQDVEVHIYEFAEGTSSTVALSPASGKVVDGVHVARSSADITVRAVDDSVTLASVILHGKYPAIQCLIGATALENSVSISVVNGAREVKIQF